jgi:hypothetical protein
VLAGLDLKLNGAQMLNGDFHNDAPDSMVSVGFRISCDRGH